MKQYLHFILNAILNLIYPKVCGICDEICEKDLCKKCEIKLNKIAVLKKRVYLTKYYGKHFYLFVYDGILKERIVNYKFNGKSYIYKSFVNFMIKNKKVCDFLKSYDIIIPVPIHVKRKRKRGYNQCELIANDLATYFENLTCVTKVLYKKIHTKPQSTKTKQERKSNIQGVYQLRHKEIIKGKKILLFDDIYTTGSTVNECCKVLKQADIQLVDVLTIAQD